MPIVRCAKGHIYNSDQSESCPACSSIGYRIDFGSNSAKPEQAAPPKRPNFLGAITGKPTHTVGFPKPGQPNTPEAAVEEIGGTITLDPENRVDFGHVELGHTVSVPDGYLPKEPEIDDPGRTISEGLGGVVLRKDAPRPVTGWLVCIKGPNAGRSYELHSDYNYIGREKGDVIIPDDMKISGEKHMTITYDPELRKFYISKASAANLIRHMGTALVSSRELNDYDLIETGDSKFVFISFCGEEFGWEDLDNKEVR